MIVLDSITKNKITIELIELDEENYCVKRTRFGWFSRKSVDFYILDRNGLSLTYESLSHESTVGTLERCKLVFNANALLLNS